MKTRNYTRAYKGIRPSACSNGQGVGNYKRTAMLGVPASEMSIISRMQSKPERKERIKGLRQAERERQKADKGLNWDLVRFILDTRNVSLDKAKEIARRI